jgi:hypothetical protein
MASEDWKMGILTYIAPGLTYEAYMRLGPASAENLIAGDVDGDRPYYLRVGIFCYHTR